jgi:hypothetical protein
VVKIVSYANHFPMISPDWKGRPYFIFADDYIYKSAGVKLAHVLCHLLNESGYRAYLTPCITSPLLNTPVLTNEVIEFYANLGASPIAVYGERIPGNPLNAGSVVRYLGNFMNHFNDSIEYDQDELLLSYAAGMNPSKEELVLHIPMADTSIFFPPKEPFERKGSLVYAGKYVDFHGGELFPINHGMYTITRGAHSETPEQLRELLQKSEYFYAYENTSLSLEALLCGCPVILMPNKHFDRIIGEQEYKNLGMAWGPSSDEMQRAKATVTAAQENYKDIIENVEPALEKFIEVSQALPFSYPLKPITIQSSISIMPLNQFIGIIRSALSNKSLGINQSPYLFSMLGNGSGCPLRIVTLIGIYKLVPKKFAILFRKIYIIIKRKDHQWI